MSRGSASLLLGMYPAMTAPGVASPALAKTRENKNAASAPKAAWASCLRVFASRRAISLSPPLTSIILSRVPETQHINHILSDFVADLIAADDDPAYFARREQIGRAHV